MSEEPEQEASIPTPSGLALGAMRRVGTPFLTELGRFLTDATIGPLADRAKVRRDENLARVLRASQTRLAAEEAAVVMRDITPSEEDRLIEGASSAYEPEIQQLWAGLLASTLNASTGVEAHPSFTTTLRMMDGWDARALQLVGQIPQKKWGSQSMVTGESILPPDEALDAMLQWVMELFPESSEGRRFSTASNLLYLGLIETDEERRASSARILQSTSMFATFSIPDRETEVQRNIPQPVHPLFYNRNRTGRCPYRLSEFGVRLARACGLTVPSYPRR